MTSRPSDHLAGLAFANLTRLGATIRGPDYPVTSPNRRRSSQSVRASSSPNATFALFERRCRGSDRAKSNGVRTLQRRGRERIVRGRISALAHLPPAHIYPVQPRKEPNVSYRVCAPSIPHFGCCFPTR